MKKITVLLLSIVIHLSAMGQDHEFIKQHLRIIFISDMTLEPRRANNQFLLNDNPQHPFWTNPEHAEAAKFLKRLIEPVPKNTRTFIRDSQLQRLVKAILLINAKPIDLYIFNDNVFTENIHRDWKNYSYCDGWLNKRFAAPCGQFRSSGNVCGTLGVGSGFLSERKNDMFGDEAFIYELVMTQLSFGFERTMPRNMDLVLANVRGNIELISSRNYATKRAIAMAFTKYFHYTCLAPPTPGTVLVETEFYENKKCFNWLNKNLPLKLLVPRQCANEGVPAQFCLTELLRQDGYQGEIVKPGSSCLLPIRQLSSRLLLHNEMIQAEIFYQFMRLSKKMGPLSLFVNVIKNSQLELAAYKDTDVFNILFKNLTIQSRDSRAMGEYLPIAILDYCTGLKITNKKDLVLSIGTYVSLQKEQNINLDDYFDLIRSSLLYAHNSGSNAKVFTELNLDMFIRAMTESGGRSKSTRKRNDNTDSNR
ncbi:MAG: hypothetical protein R8P61_32390 [Bacteroidia bacterium]|nr:hypothetical protein [Bacteroidia bacterium]